MQFHTSGLSCDEHEMKPLCVCISVIPSELCCDFLILLDICVNICSSPIFPLGTSAILYLLIRSLYTFRILHLDQKYFPSFVVCILGLLLKFLNFMEKFKS